MDEISKEHPNFHFVPALSQPDAEDEWDGETGFIADVISRKIENMSGMDAYLCGPPIMIETSCDALRKVELRVPILLMMNFNWK